MKSQKIAILTQPLHNNYGGLLQSYALKETIRGLGHNVVIINRQFNSWPEWKRYASIAKSMLTGRKIEVNMLLSKDLQEEISKKTSQFIFKYYPELSKLIDNEYGMKDLNRMNIDAYVVGSDQCWRPIYSPSIKNYFLDFAQNEKNVKRISYAASFGVSEWEFTEEDTIVCSKLLKKFDSVSVREDSAIKLLSNHLDRDDAIHVLDPTMLLNLEQYIQIVESEGIRKSPGTLKTYILDKTPEKYSIVNEISNKLSLSPFEVMPKRDLSTDKATAKNICDFVYPNPAEWIRGFMDAKFVVTDSFHGCVFSILFNVPFIAIGNETRGLSRFKSLLKMFNLENRLVDNPNLFNVDDFAYAYIDWKEVNDKLIHEKKKAISFLTNSLD